MYTVTCGARDNWSATCQNQQNGCASSEDSDQPRHPHSLTRLFAVRMKKACVLSYSLSASEDSDQNGRMPRLIWIVAGRTLILLILSCRGVVILLKPVEGDSLLPYVRHVSSSPYLDIQTKLYFKTYSSFRYMMILHFAPNFQKKKNAFLQNWEFWGKILIFENTVITTER